LFKDNEAVDLVLTDFSMPRMNGAELARQVMPMRPGMPILVASGYAERPVGEEMNLPRIAKPFHQGQLAIQLQKFSRAPKTLDGR
jgi:two-component SAPR family response regulator